MSEALNTTWSAKAQEAAERAVGSWLAGDKHWSSQHIARAWEYELALSAIRMVDDINDWDSLALDVGGAGSPLAWIVAASSRIPMQVIDPEFNGLGIGDPGYPDPETNFKAATMTPLYGKADFISCISVIEHVADEDAFLRDLVSLLAPGGVLFLTTDYDPFNSPKDTFEYHWMRKRIYNHESLWHARDSLMNKLAALGLSLFGGCGDVSDETIPELGYSFASLCMRKDPQ